MMGPCAKKRVTCEITTADGRVFTGENSCRKPQSVCPREGDMVRDDFEKCRLICDQPFHAEVAAISEALRMGADLKGAVARVQHHRVCPNCATLMERYGITWITEETRT